MISLTKTETESDEDYCVNGGTLLNGKCDCLYPYTGTHCSEFACDHGLSVGHRYDPESVFFRKKCICDENWSGDLCNIPIANQCNERGQFINGRCSCHGFYFGPQCQYVGKCVHGKLIEGICQCEYGYEGDYCDEIVCHHGYQDRANNSASCICPPRHTGTFCDECLLQSEHILPFPNCTEEIRPSRAKLSRSKTDQLILTRSFIIVVLFATLIIILSVMYIRNWGARRARESPDNEIHLQAIASERQMILQQAISFSGSHSRNSAFIGPNRLDHDYH